MRETSFARKVMGSQAGQAEEPEEQRDWRNWRNGFGADNAGNANPLSISLRYKEGRRIDGLSMGLYKRHQWMDGGGKVERLLLLFNDGGVYVEGLHLKPQVEALLEEGKLKRIQEHNTAEIAAIQSHNLDKRNPEDKEPIVLRIVVSPAIETVVASDENLAEIAKVMKGEDA